jgi:hypothetical protein
MSSIIRHGDTFHGISVFGRGVFTNNNGSTYAGQHRDGHACGLGVRTYGNKSKVYAEHGPDGQYHGRYLYRDTGWHTEYRLYERGKYTDSAHVSANGPFRPRCKYNGEACAPDDPRLLALIAQVAPVEVRPTAAATHPPLARPLAPKQSSDGSAGSIFPAGTGGRRGHRGAPPRRTPSLAAVRHNPTAAAMQRTTTQ